MKKPPIRHKNSYIAKVRPNHGKTQVRKIGDIKPGKYRTHGINRDNNRKRSQDIEILSVGGETYTYQYVDQSIFSGTMKGYLSDCGVISYGNVWNPHNWLEKI